MLSTHHTCQHRFQNDANETETETEGPQTPLADSSTQKDLPRIERTAQTIHYWELQYLEVPLGPSRQSWVPWMQEWPDGWNLWTSCQIVWRAKQMWCIQESKLEINAWHHALAWAEQQPCLKFLQGDGKVTSKLKPSELTDSQDKGG